MDSPNLYDKNHITLNDKGQQIMRREDELRLLYLTKMDTESYPNPPLSPWPPFGVTRLHNAAIEAQSHAACQHSWSYSHWNWRLKSGRSLKDTGIYIHPDRVSYPLVTLLPSHSTDTSVIQANISEDVSQMATQIVFTWALFEGRRIEERDIWEHEWLRDLGNDDESGDDV
jgi:hypothetical protein